MSFLAPLALLLGLLALPILVLYMLRLRRREVAVSSTLLWQKLVRDREANAPWQRLRRNLLLLLQLLILAALVLALARPFLPTDSVITGNTIVLLDASASMQATDVAPTRFAAAQAIVRDLIDDLSGSDRMTLIHVGRTPTVLVSTSGDRGVLQRAAAEAQPEAGTADWESALALASGAAQGFTDARVVIVSDGGLPADLPPVPAEIVYLPVGSSGENVAISALATRDTEGGPQLFAAVSNAGTTERSVLLSVLLDGALFDARRVRVPAGDIATATWSLPAETAVISATLSDNPEDILPLDDRAWAVNAGGVKSRALLVTEGNLFLEQALRVLPGLETVTAVPGSDLVAEPFDLFLFDGVVVPDPPPDADLLIVNPQPGTGSDVVQVTGTFTNTTALRLADSPLLQFVDWSGVRVREAKAVAAPWAQTLVEAEGGPLLLAGERNGRRAAVLTFDVRDSDLPLQIAFPILMANITNWLRPGGAFDAPTSLEPGQPLRITPGAGDTAVTVSKPDGTTWTAAIDTNDLIFADTSQPGLYQVNLEDTNGTRPAGSFAVNLFAPAEVTVRPAASIQVGQTTVETAVAGQVGQRELWPWLAGAALIVLLVEWWVHFRGARRPQIRLKRLSEL